jgi:hypothetical protein
MDADTRAARDDHGAIHLWLRPRATNRLVETRTRRLLQERYATTLPRFDLMAQLERVPDPDDRRAILVRLTATGRRSFAVMAAEHERWIVESFGGLSRREVATMASLLARLKTHVRSLEERDR